MFLVFTYRYFLHQWPNLCILVSIIFYILNLNFSSYVSLSSLTEKKAMSKGEAIGCVVCKIDEEEVKEFPDSDIDVVDQEPVPVCAIKTLVKHGYIAMLAVDKAYRKHGIGTSLADRALQRMYDAKCTSVVLETETCNQGAMRLYERLGFIREELLVKYYLNWGDAYRLRLWFDN